MASSEPRPWPHWNILQTCLSWSCSVEISSWTLCSCDPELLKWKVVQQGIKSKGFIYLLFCPSALCKLKGCVHYRHKNSGTLCLFLRLEMKIKSHFMGNYCRKPVNFKVLAHFNFADKLLRSVLRDNYVWWDSLIKSSSILVSVKIYFKALILSGSFYSQSELKLELSPEWWLGVSSGVALPGEYVLFISDRLSCQEK